ncbi:hypothetical protein EK904_005491 [Melospiza melodia maxima]|nr:hypothetical protein EK904_005491 [Melospiza melodia maxima]
MTVKPSTLGEAGANLWVDLCAVKPEAPVKLRLELAERGQVKLCWSSPAPLPFPLQHQVRVSAPPGHRGDSQMLQVALESSMAMDNALLDSPSSVQARWNRHTCHGTSSLPPGFQRIWNVRSLLANTGWAQLTFSSPVFLVTSAPTLEGGRGFTGKWKN